MILIQCNEQHLDVHKLSFLEISYFQMNLRFQLNEVNRHMNRHVTDSSDINEFLLNQMCHATTRLL